MGIHIEAQYAEEVSQIKSRETQIENTKKLNNITPIIETLDDVNLSKIESDTSEIKDIVLQNLDEQTNLDDISQSLDQLNKNISTLKGQFTKLSNKIDETMKTLNTGDKND